MSNPTKKKKLIIQEDSSSSEDKNNGTSPRKVPQKISNIKSAMAKYQLEEI